MLLFIYFLTEFISLAQSQVIFPGGVWQHGGDSFVESNYSIGWMFTFDWNTTEPSDNVWNWTVIDQQLNTALKIRKDLPIILVPYTGIKAPRWLYTQKGVPIVYLQNGHGPYPWYFDNTYNIYYKRWAMNIYQHIMNSDYKNNVVAVQQTYGDSGNEFPYHQNVAPANASYNITPGQWWIYEQNMSTYLYNSYYHESSKQGGVKLLYNMAANDTIEIFQETPCQMMKASEGGYSYQRNHEATDFISGKSMVLRNYDSANKCWVHGRCEIGAAAATTGYVVEAPYWNWLSMMEWTLTYGLDISNIASDVIQNNSFDKAWELKNTFGGIKNASESPGGWIHLRDGLDSNNTERFPVSQFGKPDINNCTDRMIKIANYMSSYGAAQEDPPSACGKGGNQGKALKLNDVGFNIYEYNYGNFITEVGNTSQGYWRVGSMTDVNDIYGRFAKGFKRGYDSICFRFDRGLWGGLPLKKDNTYTLKFSIAYFDNGTNEWSFGYDDVNNDKCGNNDNTIFKMTNTKKWIVTNIEVDGNDAYFGQRCDNDSDFCLFNKQGGNGNDVRFSQILVLNK